MTAVTPTTTQNWDTERPLKVIHVRLPNTSDSDDTFTVDLSAYGASTLRGVLGYVETTEGSVVVQEQPTTAVSSSTLTITVGGSSVDNKYRTYIIYAN